MNTENATNAMLVDVRISSWTARKQDKRVASAVAKQNNIADHMGSYYKSLVDSPELKEVNRLAGAARDVHYKWTLPWLDSGPRVLPAKAFFEYTQELNGMRAAFERAAADFVAAYPSRKYEVRQLLGASYNEADYPTTDQVAGKFAFNIHFAPLPLGSDFRCDVGEAQTEAIRKEITDKTNQAVESAVASLYTRMASVVQAFTERLGEPDRVFRDSLVDNAKELVAILPQLNITGNPEIEALSQRIRDCLCKYDPNTLRNNPAARAETCAYAADINDDLLNYLQGGNP